MSISEPDLASPNREPVATAKSRHCQVQGVSHSRKLLRLKAGEATLPQRDAVDLGRTGKGLLRANH